jgi:DNA-binding protein HU-beta
MNKAELIEVLTARLDTDRRQATDAVEHLIDAIVRAVQKGESVTITGFGVFERRRRAARVARNPRTGETVKVKPTSVPAFRPGAQFKAIVSGSQKLPSEGPAVKRGAADGAVRKSTVAVKKAVKKAPARKAPVKKAAAKRVVKKAAVKRVVKKAVKKAAVKRVVKKAVRKTAVKKAVKKAPAKRVVKKAPAKRVVKKAVKKAPAKRVVKKAVKKAPARKVVVKRVVKKAPARKAPAKRR